MEPALRSQALMLFYRSYSAASYTGTRVAFLLRPSRLGLENSRRYAGKVSVGNSLFLGVGPIRRCCSIICGGLPRFAAFPTACSQSVSRSGDRNADFSTAGALLTWRRSRFAERIESFVGTGTSSAPRRLQGRRWDAAGGNSPSAASCR